jgi:copper transport protein
MRGMAGRRHGRAATAALAAIVVAAVALVVAPSALAHAELQSSEPARGAVVPRQPAQLTLRFTEPVELAFGAVRVFDAAGGRVDDGRAAHLDGDGSALAVGLRPGLPDGSYTATYRVISADSHPVSGGFVFSIGTPGGAPARPVDELIGGGGGHGPVGTAAGVTRWLAYVAIAVGVGAIGFLLLVWRPALAATAGAGREWAAAAGRFDRRARAILAGAAVAGIASGVAGIVLQGAVAADISVADALDPGVIDEVLGTRFGGVWGIRTLAWVALGAVGVAALTPRMRPRLLVVAAAPALAIAATPALAGHAASASPGALLVPLDVAHVLATAVWAGGLAMLLLAVPAATRRLAPPDRSRLLAASLVRFSPLALGAVIVLLATGVAQSLVHLEAVGDLAGTDFGRALVAKAVLLAALIALGAVNSRRVVPRMRRLATDGGAPGGAGVLLRRTLAGEVGLLLAVLGVTAALVHFAPPGEASPGPFSAEVALGDARLEVTVEPARVGPNEIRVDLFRADDGGPYTATRELRVEASLPEEEIGPIAATPRPVGPGRWVVTGGSFAVPGTWRLRVGNRVSEFDEHTATVEVPVR